MEAYRLVFTEVRVDFDEIVAREVDFLKRMCVPPLLNEIFQISKIDDLIRELIELSVLKVKKSGLFGALESSVDITASKEVVLFCIFEESLVLLTSHN